MAKLSALALALAACLSAVGVSHAQALQRLNVTQLTLSADTTQPKLEQPFHLIVTAHVRERVAGLDNLVLPLLAELELLGDERGLTSQASGTTYREVITVVAHHTGTIDIAPVTLDAIDARNGKRTRFSSNALRLVVEGGALEPAAARAGDLVWRTLRAALVVIGVASLAVIVVLFVRRPRPVRAEPIFVPPPVVSAPRSADTIFADALATLRAERTRATAMRVRHVVRSLVGASDTETLGDVLQRPKANDRGMREVLSSLERAAFTHEGDLQPAISHAIAALEGMVS